MMDIMGHKKEVADKLNGTYWKSDRDSYRFEQLIKKKKKENVRQSFISTMAKINKLCVAHCPAASVDLRSHMMITFFKKKFISRD